MSDTFLDADTSNVPELIPVSGDQEVEVRLISFMTDADDKTIRTDKNGNPFFLPMYEIVNEPNAPEFTDFMGLPGTDMEDKESNKRLRKLANWKKCLGLPETGMDLKDAIGCVGWVMIGLKNDPEYGDQNTIKRYIAPK